MTELELGQELAKIALEAESLPRYGDDEEYYDETAPEVLLDQVARSATPTRGSASPRQSSTAPKLEEAAYDEVRQRPSMDAYGPKKIKDPRQKWLRG